MIVKGFKKSLLLGIGALVSCSFAQPAFAQKGTVYSDALDWAVQKVENQSGGQPYCLMTTSFEQGVTLSLAQNADSQMSLGIEFSDPLFESAGADTVEVVLDPGAGVQITRDAVPTSPRTIVLRMGQDEEFFKALQKTGYLRAEVGQENFGFNLSNIDSARLRLDNCVYSIPRPELKKADMQPEPAAPQVSAALESKMDALQSEVARLSSLTEQLAYENQQLSQASQEPDITDEVSEQLVTRMKSLRAAGEILQRQKRELQEAKQAIRLQELAIQQHKLELQNEELRLQKAENIAELARQEEFAAQRAREQELAHLAKKAKEEMELRLKAEEERLRQEREKELEEARKAKEEALLAQKALEEERQRLAEENVREQAMLEAKARELAEQMAQEKLAEQRAREQMAGQMVDERIAPKIANAMKAPASTLRAKPTPPSVDMRSAKVDLYKAAPETDVQSAQAGIPRNKPVMPAPAEEMAAAPQSAPQGAAQSATRMALSTPAEPSASESLLVDHARSLVAKKFKEERKAQTANAMAQRQAEKARAEAARLAAVNVDKAPNVPLKEGMGGPDYSFKSKKADTAGLLPLLEDRPRAGAQSDPQNLYAAASSMKTREEMLGEQMFEGELYPDEFADQSLSAKPDPKASREALEKEVLRDEEFFNDLMKEFEELEAEVEEQIAKNREMAQAELGKAKTPQAQNAAPPPVMDPFAKGEDVKDNIYATRSTLSEAQAQDMAMADEDPKASLLKPVRFEKGEAGIVATPPKAKPEPEPEPQATVKPVAVEQEIVASSPAESVQSPANYIPVSNQGPARQSVFIPDFAIQNVLADASVVAPDKVRRVDQASGPDAVVHQWRLGNVYGSAEQRPVTNDYQFEGLVQDYLEKTENRCQGDYAIMPDKTVDSDAARIDTYEIACVGEDVSSTASLLFVKKDNTFTVFAHEAAVEEMEMAMSLRDRLSKAFLQ